MGFNVRDIVHTDTGNVRGFSSSGTLSGSAEATFSGSRGSAAYTVGDIVGALKDIGVLAM